MEEKFNVQEYFSRILNWAFFIFGKILNVQTQNKTQCKPQGKKQDKTQNKAGKTQRKDKAKHRENTRESTRQKTKQSRGNTKKTSPQAKRHQPSLLITPITSLFQLL